MDVLVPDVVFVADGGGIAAAAPTPIQGAETVAVMMAQAGRVVSMVWLNGAPAIRIDSDTQPAAVGFQIEAGRISRIYAIANPAKLTRLKDLANLAR